MRFTQASAPPPDDDQTETDMEQPNGSSTRLFFVGNTEKVLLMQGLDKAYLVDIGAWRFPKLDADAAIAFANAVQHINSTDWTAFVTKQAEGFTSPAQESPSKNALPANHVASKIISWLRQPYGEGTISPVSEVTYQQWKEMQVRQRTRTSIRAALVIDPFHPMALALHAHFQLSRGGETVLGQHAHSSAKFYYARKYAEGDAGMLVDVLALEAATMIELWDSPRAEAALAELDKQLAAVSDPTAFSSQHADALRRAGDVRTKLKNKYQPPPPLTAP